MHETMISDHNLESQTFKLKYISTKPELNILETVGQSENENSQYLKNKSISNNFLREFPVNDTQSLN